MSALISYDCQQPAPVPGAQAGLGRAIEVVEGERVRVRGLIGGVMSRPDETRRTVFFSFEFSFELWATGTPQPADDGAGCWGEAEEAVRSNQP
jgi:hypothetical protein